MKAWWLQRTERERALLGALGALFAAFAVWAIAIAPLAGWRSGAAARAAAAEDGYRIVARAAAIPRPAATSSDVAPRNALNAAAAAGGVSLTFVNALPDGSIEVQAGPAPPAAVFALFARLDREYGVRVRNADIARTLESPDLVRVQATLAQ